MTQYAYPFGDQDVSDEQFRRYARTYAGTQVHTGLTVSANSTGMNVKVAAGFATVQGLAFYNDSTVTQTISANNAANPRIDTIVLRLDYSASPAIQVGVVEGVPRANPVAPTLTQTDMGVFEFPLADVRVTAGMVSVPATAISARPTDATYKTTRTGLKLWSSPDVRSLVHPTNTANWNVNVWTARLVEGMLFLSLYATRRTPWTAAVYWDGSELARLDSSLTPAWSGLHFPAVNNLPDAPFIHGYVAGDTIFARAQRPTNITAGMWFQVNMALPIA